MALMKNKHSEMPSDAIILSENEALQYQLKLIRSWKDSNDTWVFKHGFSILASLGALTSIYINNHYRQRLRLQNFGRFSSYLPIVGLPAIGCAVFHQQFVVRDVLLQKNCTTCLQVRSASYQTVLGIVFPAILAQAAAIPFAIRYNTYTVPSITKQPRETWAFLLRLSRPIKGTLTILAVLHAVVATTLTYWEFRSMASISEKLNALEERLQYES